MKTNAKVVIAIFMILIFEGAVRKWISESVSLPAILLRDLLCAYLLVYGYKEVLQNKDIVFIKIGLIISFFLILFILFQTMFMHQSIFIALIGIRFWIVYPLAALIAAITINECDFKLIIKYLVYSLFLLVPLAFIQYNLPPTSFINKQVTDEGYIFELVSGVVRVTGTYSFTLGYSIFITYVLNLCFMVYFKYSYFNIKKNTSIALVALALLGCLISGSRGVVLTSIVSLVAFMIALIFSRQSKNALINNFIVMLLLIGSIFLFSSSSYVQNITERFISASYSEDIGNRISNIIFGEQRFKLEPTILGQGLGSGSNLSTQFTGKDGFYLGETETARSYNESGIVFLLLLTIKVSFLIIGLYYSLRNIIFFKDFSVFLVWIVASQILFTWQLSGQLTANGLGFFFLAIFGLIIRYSNPSKPEKSMQY